MTHKVGYVRVSTSGQNTIRQEVLMSELDVDIIFIDKASGKDNDRSELKKMLEYVRKGDVVIVESISRIARNTRHLLDIIDLLKQKEVQFISKKESIDTNTPAGQFMLTVFGALAQLEREHILLRQAEGIEIAKTQGKYKGRQKIVSDKFEKIYKEWKAENITATRAMDMLDMKRNTFYRRVAEYEMKMVIK